MGQPAVSLEAVTKVYHEGAPLTALRDVSVAFPRGGFTAIMGPSGSGKSTLLQCAAGLDTPTSGVVAIGGVRIDGMGEAELTAFRRERLGFVFQAYHLLPGLTVADNITLPLRLAGRPVPDGRLAEIAGHVGLAERLRDRPGALSGGQRQRVAVARALIARPEVLFADEPTGALDLASGHRVLELLRAATDHFGQTIVMVTHDPAAAAVADSVLFLADGEVRETLRRPTADTVAARMTRLGAW